MKKTQTWFYDTGTKDHNFFGPNYWDNLRDPLNGGKNVLPERTEITSFRVFAPADASVEDLHTLSCGTIELSLPISSTLRVTSEPLVLSSSEIRLVSVKLKNIDSYNGDVSVTLFGHQLYD